MTDEQKGMSEQREKEYESISREDVQEMIEKILLKRDLAGEGDVEVLYKKLNEYAARENINPREDSGRKKIEDLALDILSEREAIKKNQPDGSFAIEKDSVVGVGGTPENALRDALKNKGKNL